MHWNHHFGPIRSKGDRHCCHTRAHQRPETRPGSHQGTNFVCEYVKRCVAAVLFHLLKRTSLSWCVMLPSVLSLCAFADQDQFEFALTAVAEEVNAILKALPQWMKCSKRTHRWYTVPNKNTKKKVSYCAFMYVLHHQKNMSSHAQSCLSSSGVPVSNSQFYEKVRRMFMTGWRSH